MSSRFMELPAELRVRIYEYTFGDNDPEEIELFEAIEKHPDTALLETSREIYNEAQPTHAAAAARYRRAKTFTVMLDPKLTEISDFIELFKRFEQLTFPFYVQSLLITWLGSTASLHFKTDESAKFRILAQKGKCTGSLQLLIDNDQFETEETLKSVDQPPFVFPTEDKRHSFGALQLVSYALSASLPPSDVKGRDACSKMLMSSQKALHAYLSQTRRPRAHPKVRKADDKAGDKELSDSVGEPEKGVSEDEEDSDDDGVTFIL